MRHFLKAGDSDWLYQLVAWQAGKDTATPLHILMYLSTLMSPRIFNSHPIIPEGRVKIHSDVSCIISVLRSPGSIIETTSRCFRVKLFSTVHCQDYCQVKPEVWSPRWLLRNLKARISAPALNINLNCISLRYHYNLQFDFKFYSRFEAKPLIVCAKLFYKKNGPDFREVWEILSPILT